MIANGSWVRWWWIWRWLELVETVGWSWLRLWICAMGWGWLCWWVESVDCGSVVVGLLKGDHRRGWGGFWLRFCGGFKSRWVWFDFGSWFGFGILGLDLVRVGLDLIYNVKEDVKPRRGRRWRGGESGVCVRQIGSRSAVDGAVRSSLPWEDQGVRILWFVFVCVGACYKVEEGMNFFFLFILFYFIFLFWWLGVKVVVGGGSCDYGWWW